MSNSISKYNNNNIYGDIVFTCFTGCSVGDTGSVFWLLFDDICCCCCCCFCGGGGGGDDCCIELLLLLLVVIVMGDFLLNILSGNDIGNMDGTFFSLLSDDDDGGNGGGGCFLASSISIGDIIFIDGIGFDWGDECVSGIDNDSTIDGIGCSLTGSTDCCGCAGCCGWTACCIVVIKGCCGDIVVVGIGGTNNTNWFTEVSYL